MKEPYSPPLAEPLAQSKGASHAGLRTTVYWILVVTAMLIMVLVWVGQISVCGLGLSMSNSHAADDSEGGAFVWFLLSKAAQFGFLGWHSMPIALCAVGQVIRRKDDLLKNVASEKALRP